MMRVNGELMFNPFFQDYNKFAPANKFMIVLHHSLPQFVNLLMLMLQPGLKKEALDTPCLIINKDHLKYNLNLMRQHAMTHKIAIRPHVKTHKSSQLAKLQVEYGAIGISAAKVSEAQTLIDAGIRNILITSPLVTKNKIANLIACLQKAPETLVVVDNEKNLMDLNTAGACNHVKINVLVDIDSGIGRTGVLAASALDFALKIRELPWLNLMGIQCYAGNLQHIVSYEDRKNRSLNVMQMASDLVKRFKSQGLPCPILTGTGTGTYDIDIEAAEVTEIQPGSYTVMDVEYATIGSRNNAQAFATFRPAMTLLTTVISQNRHEHVTVDAGTKSIYFDATNKPQIISHPGLQYDWGSFGDEHGKITAVANARLPENGEVLELIVPHCDPTINLFDQFFIIEDDVLVDIWDIDLRGKSQ